MHKISPADLELLRKYDTPTICNVVELFDHCPRTAVLHGRAHPGLFPEAAADGRLRVDGDVPLRLRRRHRAMSIPASISRSPASRSCRARRSSCSRTSTRRSRRRRSAR